MEVGGAKLTFSSFPPSFSLRIFAKPFVASMEGHTDGVYCLGRDPRRTDVIAGGGGDGGKSHSLFLPSFVRAQSSPF